MNTVVCPCVSLSLGRPAQGRQTAARATRREHGSFSSLKQPRVSALWDKQPFCLPGRRFFRPAQAGCLLYVPFVLSSALFYSPMPFIPFFGKSSVRFQTQPGLFSAKVTGGIQSLQIWRAAKGAARNLPLSAKRIRGGRFARLLSAFQIWQKIIPARGCEKVRIQGKVKLKSQQ